MVLTLGIILPPLAAQTTDLTARLPQYIDQLQRWLTSHRILLHPITLEQIVENGPNPNEAVTGLLGAVNHAAGLVLTGFTVLLLSFYMLLDGEAMFEGFLRWLPAEARNAWMRMGEDAAAKVGGWLGGQFALCGLIGITSAFGFWLLGLPYFYVLALVCGLAELVPLIGPIIAAVPAILVGATVGFNTAALVTVYLFVQQQLNANIIIPRLMQKQTGVSPIIVMVAILCGGLLLGVVGALLAVPTAAIMQIMVREYLNYRDDS